MPLSPGTRLGPYEIAELLGHGGMGEVYRARDPRLNRDVAIKISREQFNERFEREARAVAALNHPNICTLHDVGPNFLVMELVEGDTLAERIAAGPIPIQEALRIAKQIAEALEAAHERGIVHRDLKPANIKIRPDGSVKVLDFGLAKQAAGEIESGALTQTVFSAAGTIVGTAGYMSPEQARGLPVDKRADIWAFGVVLYEMATGRRLFEGDTMPDTLVAVLTREPDWERVPPRLQRLLRACLEKVPRNRLRDIGDMSYLLEDGVAAPAPAGNHRNKPAIAAAGFFALTAGALGFIHFREKPPAGRPVHSSIPPPANTEFGFDIAPYGTPALSPDGRRVVFGARSKDGSARLWVRSLDSAAAEPLAGTEAAAFAYPFWSSDSRLVGFGAGGKLMSIDPAGGPALALADAPNFRGASWSRQGVIVFAPNSVGPMQRIPQAGGTPSPATSLDPARKETSHRWPWFLPDGRHFLYASVVGNTNDVTIYAGSLDSRETRMLLQANSNAIYGAGHLLFLRENTLMAQPFDPKRMAATGEAVRVAGQVADNTGNAFGFFTISEDGTLIFQPGSQVAQTLASLDRTGRRLADFGETGSLARIFLAPDGKRATVSVLDRAARSNDLWIYDLVRNVRSRFTFDPGSELEGIWSPDGSQIVFSSNRRGHFDLYRKASGGAGMEELLYMDGLSKYPTSWSPDGKFVLYYATGDAQTGYDLWLLPLEGERKPAPFLKTGFNELLGQFSPDGHWIAYTSDQSGRYEIYVAPFQGKGGIHQVSGAGGFVPRWRADGREIFYIGLDGRLMAADVNGSGAEIGPVHALFGPLPSNGYQYDISADGQRILAVMPAQQNAPEPLTLLQNWVAGVKAP